MKQKYIRLLEEKEMNKKMKKKIILAVLIVVMAAVNLSGCALLDSKVNDLNGVITGNTYHASFYSNDGEKFMDMSGQKINLVSNIVKEQTYTDGSWGYTKTLSSMRGFTENYKVND